MQNDVVVGGVFVTFFEPFLDFDLGEERLAVAVHPRQLHLEVIGTMARHGAPRDFKVVKCLTHRVDDKHQLPIATLAAAGGAKRKQ